MAVLSKEVEATHDVFLKVVDMTWFALQQPVGQNPLFNQFFFDLDVLLETAADAKLGFAPGLFEALDGDEPPDVSFFENLPTGTDKRWADYAIVLRHPDGSILIYFGCGTEAIRGVATRFIVYNNPFQYSRAKSGKSSALLPKHMEEALDLGYVITHKGLLAWCDLPKPVDVPRFRLLFVAMEAAFCFQFWGMMEIDQDYGIGACCPWPPQEFDYPYGGLCGHSSLQDPIRIKPTVSATPIVTTVVKAPSTVSTGNTIASYFSAVPKASTTPIMSDDELSSDLSFTQEQVNTLILTAKQKASLRNKASYKRMRKFDLEGYKARNRRNAATYRKNSADKKRVNERRWSAKAWASDDHNCQLCGVRCTNQYTRTRHEDSRRHKVNVKRAALLVHRCEICNKGFTKPCHLKRHRTGQRHQEKVAARLAVAFSTPSL